MGEQGFYKFKQRWQEKITQRRAEAIRRKKLISEKGRTVFEKYGIRRAILFGSVAENRCCENSDIDIFVEPLSAEKFWTFRREFEEELDAPIDLYTDTDEGAFVKKIAERGVVVYEV